MNKKSNTAIAGLGITQMGKIYNKSVNEFAIEAIDLALKDAGMNKTDLDGLLISPGSGSLFGSNDVIGLSLQRALGLVDLQLLSVINAYGSTAGAMIQYASMACEAGMANAVACVFADNPLKENTSAGAAYVASRKVEGLDSIDYANGILGLGTNVKYAMAARMHMETYGTTSEQLGSVAVSQRKWALMNERAQMKKPLTMTDYLNSRLIADPFHLYDCCLLSNGAIAVIVTKSDYAKSLKQPPVYIWGFGQGHSGDRPDKLIKTGAEKSSKMAYNMAGITPKDVDICEIYDCYTYTALVTFEDYGFCKKGEGGAVFESGYTAPGGKLPVNTGGGQLSSYYMWGMTPLSEAIIQARGQGGKRQVDKHDIVITSGNGGILDYHSTLILSPNELR